MEEKKGLGIAALVVAILGFCSWWLGAIAIILAIVALVKKSGKGFAIAAIIIAVIGIILNILVISTLNFFGGVVDEALREYSGDVYSTEVSGDESVDNWFSSWISEGVDELNSQIETGVSEFSDAVTDINDQVVEGVEEGVENLNEGVEAVGEGIEEGVETINEAITGEEAE